MYDKKLVDLLQSTKRVMQLEELAKLLYCSINTVKRIKVNINKTNPNLVKTKYGRKGGYYI